MTTNNNVINHSNSTAAKSATFVSGLPDLNSGRKHTDKLPILISSRIRLNDEQRSQLKLAWQQMRAEEAPAPSSMPGSTVKAYAVAKAETALKTSALIISDLLTSRDTIPLATIFELQKLFNIQLISEKQFIEACRGYWNFNRDKNDG